MKPFRISSQWIDYARATVRRLAPDAAGVLALTLLVVVVPMALWR